MTKQYRTTNPEDMAYLLRSGLAWKSGTEVAEESFQALLADAIPYEEAQDVPDDVRARYEREYGVNLARSGQ